MKRSFVIDCFPESARRYRKGCAIVAVDVIRATTMAVTAVSRGRECYPVGSLDEAFRLAQKLPNPLLAGELAGDMPAGFEMNNSPAELIERDDINRPLVMLSSSGTRLIAQARGCDAIYLGCFRNSRSLGQRLAQGEHNRIALIGAGSRGEFREEDQMGCAWIATELVRSDYVPEDKNTADIVRRWADAKPTDCLVSKSVRYLEKTNQLTDLDFILDHINDLEDLFMFKKQQVIIAPEVRPEWQPTVVPAY